MSERHIHLTFDDGPHPVWTPHILDALEEADAKATFFVIGPLARRYPELIEAALQRGHRVELHCTEHIRHTERTRREVERDTGSGLATLQAIGARPALWRPPWGVLAPWTEAVAESLGLEVALWDADTHDWRGDSAKGMLESIEPALGPGSVVLMHDGLGPGARRTGCANTAGLVGPLVERIRLLGCEPAPMSPSFERARIGA